jgi:hypothetical protein
VLQENCSYLSALRISGVWSLHRDITKRPETFTDLLSIREKAKQLTK